MIGKTLCILGTDTGVGKTFVTAHLTKKYQEAGINCIPFKPISCGSSMINEREIWADTTVLAEASSCPEEEISL